ncbi:MAG: 50S ribosomal protein L9 [Alphaproteobacteria bacterium]|nr:50S ribosomal protein L9 [Alphaproteobacteria bacterium]
MEVILLEHIDRLGSLGQTVKVRPGFARNYLLPKKKALRATKANLELFEKQRVELEAKNASARAVAEELAAKMKDVELVLIRQASELGQLFGSVTARDVAEVAKGAGHAISRLQIQIDAPIKTLGLFPVKVKLHPEVSMMITVNVARSAEEAVAQADKAKAETKASEERAQVEAAFGVPASEPKAEKAVEAAEPKAKKATKKTPKKATKKEADAKAAE